MRGTRRYHPGDLPILHVACALGMLPIVTVLCILLLLSLTIAIPYSIHFYPNVISYPNIYILVSF